MGTFLGILLCYGFLGPMAANLKKQSDAESEYLGSSLRMGLLAYMEGNVSDAGPGSDPPRDSSACPADLQADGRCLP